MILEILKKLSTGLDSIFNILNNKEVEMYLNYNSMNNSSKVCPKCTSIDIKLNSQVTFQSYSPGKDLKVIKYPKYLCKDCSHTFDV